MKVRKDDVRHHLRVCESKLGWDVVAVADCEVWLTTFVGHVRCYRLRGSPVDLGRFKTRAILDYHQAIKDNLANRLKVAGAA